MKTAVFLLGIKKQGEIVWFQIISIPSPRRATEFQVEEGSKRRQLWAGGGRGANFLRFFFPGVRFIGELLLFISGLLLIIS